MTGKRGRRILPSPSVHRCRRADEKQAAVRDATAACAQGSMVLMSAI
jgi:hypothetical protein